MDGQFIFMANQHWQDPQYQWVSDAGIGAVPGALGYPPHPSQSHAMVGAPPVQSPFGSLPYGAYPHGHSAGRPGAFHPQPAYQTPQATSYAYANQHHYQSGMASQPQVAYQTPQLFGPHIQRTVPAMFPHYGPFSHGPVQHPAYTSRQQPLDGSHLALKTPGRHHPAMIPSPSMAQSSGLVAPLSPQLPRGPPRKPKRSGNAIWVGNIPLNASIEALKDHFSRNATADIESVFLMSKSNCAFVNYKTEEACSAAVDRFNSSLFGAVRLLCRMRRDPSARQAQSRQSPALSSVSSQQQASDTRSSSEQIDGVDGVNEAFTGLGINQTNDSETTESSPQQHQPAPVIDKPSDRYFIIKSLTKEDLQESLMKGTWETQPHNQQALDQAFRDAANVYLIFSVNKSGEYFGYARMSSSPFDCQQPASPTTPNQPTTPGETLNIRRTPATNTAPKGYIIEDAARGTLFWEAEDGFDSIVSSNGDLPPELNGSSGNMQSRPFQVEWQSVRRVTFQRTKGLRNNWNSNKEVKVARDGTELETGLGKKVVALFHEKYEDLKKGGE